ncbi:MAG: ribosomal protein S18-alanine N-acetyltransferase [Methylomonas sp.]|nr:ribosomal protein S18-alanine N-acetyltransferase [Methylomonas sp.]PPD20242.1 MAG: ribosomal-protein-alanine N-acetyltransferase [Methylomonas sp.]PPD26273.1 MAG: ribosomal-protein-alanine N-acetyltransferase [Methylomonas sp.]PPD37990.1 MAG: ribosomal-protein-alanine N-acetyltransferase [Methylomonas sp.]PPD40372.1 MAG: ribosomal-protein-alanine N-acetyltransferase [Methylomonas sp.]
MWKLLHKLKDAVIYDADREFYAKVFPDSVNPRDLMRIRKMDHADLAQVLTIEQRNYEFPWSEGVFKDCFRTMTYSNWVCETPDDAIAGYGILSVAAGEAHIMNISISPRFQRQGVGRKMLIHLIEYARPKAEKMFLEVRPSNPGAIDLYHKTGFRQMGVRKDYYPAKQGREDAIMFELDLVRRI